MSYRMLSLSAAVTALAIAGLASSASAAPAGGALAIQLAQSCQMYGPYATIRRANEIAQDAGRLGYSFQVFHNGDGYYVRVC